MSAGQDIVIRIQINEEALDAHDLVRVLDILEEALYESDRTEIIRAGQQSELPGFIVDAALERLRRFRRKRIRLQAVRHGSFELDGALTAAAKYVLALTIAEAIKNGIQRSAPFTRLSQFITDGINEKYSELIKTLRVVFMSHKLSCDIQALPMPDNEPKILLIKVRLPPAKDRLPTLGESSFLDKEIDRLLK